MFYWVCKLKKGQELIRLEDGIRLTTVYFISKCFARHFKWPIL